MLSNKFSTTTVTVVIGVSCAVVLLRKLVCAASSKSTPSSSLLPEHILQCTQRLCRVDHDPLALLPLSMDDNNNSTSLANSTSNQFNSNTTAVRSNSGIVQRRSSSSTVLTNFTLPMVLVDMNAFTENVRRMGLAILSGSPNNNNNNSAQTASPTSTTGNIDNSNNAAAVARKLCRVRLATKSFRCPELIEEAARVLQQTEMQVLHDTLLQQSPHHPHPSSSSVASEFDGVDELDTMMMRDTPHSHHQGGTPSSSNGCSIVSGIMTFTPAETLFWVKRGSFQSVFLGYPIGDPHAARVVVDALLWNPTVVRCSVAVDHEAQLEYLAAAAILAVQKEKYLSQDGFDAAGSYMALHVVIDVDVSYRPIEALHVGARRSPIRSSEDILRLLESIRCINDRMQGLLKNKKLGVKIVVDGMMGYEAQIASLPDRSRRSARCCATSSLAAYCQNKLIAWFKTKSMEDVKKRRLALSQTLEAFLEKHHLSGSESLLVNGGGSGSLTRTLDDEVVTEVTIGSGALCGHLFDGFAPIAFQPAIFVALSVTRVPAEGFVTCAGGGWIASGASNGTNDRQPLVVYPGAHEGLCVTPTTMEGFGEVQTPFHVRKLTSSSSAPAVTLRIGDVVVCRPAKSGELAEHFEEYFLVDETGTLHAAATYRGVSLTPWS